MKKDLAKVRPWPKTTPHHRDSVMSALGFQLGPRNASDWKERSKQANATKVLLALKVTSNSTSFAFLTDESYTLSIKTQVSRVNLKTFGTSSYVLHYTIQKV